MAVQELLLRVFSLHFLHSGTTVGGPGGRAERHCAMSKGDLPKRIGANGADLGCSWLHQRAEWNALNVEKE